MDKLLIKQVLQDLKQLLTAHYGPVLVDIILYGSWARGMATDESDIDVMVILRGEVLSFKEIDAISESVYEINLKYNVLISLFPMSESDFKSRNTPLLMNVRKEGVPA
jgi:predicted nucleotidyltransferase